MIIYYVGEHAFFDAKLPYNYRTKINEVSTFEIKQMLLNACDDRASKLKSRLLDVIYLVAAKAQLLEKRRVLV